MPRNELMREGEHLMTVCNSCRYCEGYCAVFPAMELRLNFTDGDLRYLANLCHNCSACYYACQYAPPHEFAINPARTFAKIRLESYRNYAWPKPLAKAFTKNGLVVSVLLSFTLGVFLLGASLLLGPEALLTPVPGGNFYQITSHRFLVVTFGGISLVVVFAWIVGFIHFWRDSDERLSDLIHPLPLIEALKDVPQAGILECRRGLRGPSRPTFPGAALVSPAHFVRLHALLCGYFGRRYLSLRVRVDCALPLHEPARAARDARRHGSADRPLRALRIGAAS